MRQEFDLVNQIRFYPYEHIWNLEKFNETLSSKNEFYSSLSGERISNIVYRHVLKVWNKFEIKTMKDYHHLHLKYDSFIVS